MHLRNPGVRNKTDSGVIRNKGWSEGSGRGWGRSWRHRNTIIPASCKRKTTGPSLDAFGDLPPAFHTAGRADIQGGILEYRFGVRTNSCRRRHHVKTGLGQLCFWNPLMDVSYADGYGGHLPI